MLRAFGDSIYLLSKERHEAGAKYYAANHLRVESQLSSSKHGVCENSLRFTHKSQLLVVLGTVWVEQEVSRKEFDEARVQQNTSAGGVQNS